MQDAKEQVPPHGGVGPKVHFPRGVSARSHVSVFYLSTREAGKGVYCSAFKQGVTAQTNPKKASCVSMFLLFFFLAFLNRSVVLATLNTHCRLYFCISCWNLPFAFLEIEQRDEWEKREAWSFVRIMMTFERSQNNTCAFPSELGGSLTRGYVHNMIHVLSFLCYTRVCVDDVGLLDRSRDIRDPPTPSGLR